MPILLAHLEGWGILRVLWGPLAPSLVPEGAYQIYSIQIGLNTQIRLNIQNWLSTQFLLNTQISAFTQT